MASAMRILAYTLADLTTRRSLYVAAALCALFVLMLRGCLQGSVTVDGRPVDPAIIARHVSGAAFHVIAIASLLFTCMLSMRLLGRDRQEGTAVMLMARPVHRGAYLAGRVGGVWIAACLFMVALHLCVMLLALLRGADPMPGILPASLLCCLNLLMLSVLVCLLSLVLPDVLAGFTAALMTAVSFASESLFQLMHGTLAQAALGLRPGAAISPWRSLFPQIAGLQLEASSLLSGSVYPSMGPVPPVVNVLGYTAVFAALLAWRFRYEEL